MVFEMVHQELENALAVDAFNCPTLLTRILAVQFRYVFYAFSF